MYIHTGDKLLGFVCVETIVLTPSEDTNIMERNLMKELEEVCHLIIEGEPIERARGGPSSQPSHYAKHLKGKGREARKIRRRI